MMNVPPPADSDPLEAIDKAIGNVELLLAYDLARSAIDKAA